MSKINLVHWFHVHGSEGLLGAVRFSGINHAITDGRRYIIGQCEFYYAGDYRWKSEN